MNYSTDPTPAPDPHSKWNPSGAPLKLTDNPAWLGGGPAQPPSAVPPSGSDQANVPTSPNPAQTPAGQSTANPFGAFVDASGKPIAAGDVGKAHQAWVNGGSQGSWYDYMTSKGYYAGDASTRADASVDKVIQNSNNITPDMIAGFNASVDDWYTQAVKDTKAYYASRGLSGSGAEQDAIAQLQGKQTYYKATGKADIEQKAQNFRAQMTEFSNQMSLNYARLAQENNQFLSGQAQQGQEFQASLSEREWEVGYLGKMQLESATSQANASMWGNIFQGVLEAAGIVAMAA